MLWFALEKKNKKKKIFHSFIHSNKFGSNKISKFDHQITGEQLEVFKLDPRTNSKMLDARI